jgi:CheY-like chemotaxis protein
MRSHAGHSFGVGEEIKMNDIKPMAESSADGQGRVLILEDERNIRFLIASLLKPSGYSVVEAANGEEAIRHLKADPTITLIILDYRMLEFEGGDLIDTLRQAAPNVPIKILNTPSE